MEHYDPLQVLNYAESGILFWSGRVSPQQAETLLHKEKNPYSKEIPLLGILHKIASDRSILEKHSKEILFALLTQHWWPLNLSLLKHYTFPHDTINSLLELKQELQDITPLPSSHGTHISAPAIFIARQTLNYDTNTRIEILHAIQNQILKQIPFPEETVRALYQSYPQDVGILTIIARNPTTPVDILNELAWNTHPAIQRSLNENPSLPEVEHIIVNVLKIAEPSTQPRPRYT